MVNLNSSSSLGCLSDEPNPSFIQPFLEHMSSNKLRIPTAFNHNFNGNVPRKISLKSTSGIVWQAKLQIVDGYIYITKGWELYVKDHSLTDGDFLIFHYLQNATFLVMIFGTDGEIKNEPVPMKSGKSGTTKFGRTTTRIDFKFKMTFNKKNFVTIPRCIIKTCEPKLPQDIILRNGKGRGLKTQLHRIKDQRVIMGYFNVSEFVELGNAKTGNEIQFSLSCKHGNKIESMTMTNLSQSKKLGRGY
ncbi:uncharacterized protein LOC141643765 [Silene latifolia]|uniref:uncharacterized protein LOC141643765 n=1 Tax=Silene latifolia TaxID=37657 RepID=UPI003D770D31